MVNAKKSRQDSEINLRHVWLASLGAFAVGRREVRSAAAGAVDRVGRLAEGAYGIAVDARDIARGGLLTVREQAEPKLVGLGAEIGTRLAPVLRRLGIEANTRRPIRKAKARKPAAKKAGRRASGRKPAASVARKARG